MGFTSPRLEFSFPSVQHTPFLIFLRLYLLFNIGSGYSHHMALYGNIAGVGWHDWAGTRTGVYCLLSKSHTSKVCA
jgi:hypothetical protein